MGFLWLGLVIVTWVAQSELAQFIQVGAYNKPFLLTWFNHSFATLLLPVAVLLFYTCIKPRAHRRARAADDRTAAGASRDLRFDSRFLGVNNWWIFIGRVVAVALVYQLSDYAWCARAHSLVPHALWQARVSWAAWRGADCC